MIIPTIPNNSLFEKITQLLEISNELEENYEFNKPVTEEELSAWENQNKVLVPDSVKDWLLFANGSNIQNGLMVTYSLKEFLIGCDIMPKDFVIIGNVIGDGEFIGFSAKTEKVIWEDHGKLTEYDTFNEILERIMNIL